MIRRFGRAGARARAMQERREVAAAATEDTEDAGRIVGRCTLCTGTHGFPDLRQACPRCGAPTCFARRCECGETR